jgi:hypothetical protein
MATAPDKAVEQQGSKKEEFRMENVPAFPVDGISSLGIHNGVVRIQFIRLNTEGKAVPSVELNIPLSQLRTLAETLTKSVPR